MNNGIHSHMKQQGFQFNNAVCSSKLLCDTDRINWIDNAKAFGIVAVVFTHADSSFEYLNTLLSGFHMPLFFFLAGFLLKKNYLEMPFVNYIKKILKVLLVPYVSFWGLSYVYWLLTWRFGSQAAKYMALKFYDPFFGLIYGTRDSLYVNQPLWFFPCLFVTAIIFYILNKVTSRYWCAVIIGCSLTSPMLLLATLPWSINVSFVALIFYAFGYWCKERNHSYLLNINSRWNSIVLGICFLFFLVFSNHNGHISMAERNYGNTILLFYLNAFLGIIIVMIISHFFSSTKLAEWLSSNTIIIFPIHFLMFSIISGIFFVLFGVRIICAQYSYVGIMYTIISIVLCIPVSCVIRRYIPFVIGCR